MDQAISTDHLQRWLDAVALAWERRDPDAAAALFSDDATYHEDPFDEPIRGRAAIRQFWAEATERQTQISVRCRALVVQGDLGVAHWRASFERIATGAHAELDGIFLVRLEEDGRCSEFREWWQARETPATATPAG